MLKRTFAMGLLAVCLLSQGALAESATYHLKRLEIQTRALLSVLGEQSAPVDESNTPASEEGSRESTSQPIEQQLEQTANSPTWAEEMVREDLNSLLSTTSDLQEQLKSPNEEKYLKAKVELESLARRLRVSTAPLQLDPQQRAGLELTMLELEESIASVSIEREQQMAQKEKRRARTRVNVGVGVGWGGWGPWGYSSWGSPWGYSPYGWNTWYRPYPRFYRRGCR